MKPMLAGKFVEEKIIKKLPLYGQLKYDGIRVFIRDGIGYTRSIKPVRNAEFQSWVRYNCDWLEGLDGEIIVGDPAAYDCYRKTMKFTMTGAAQGDFSYYVFDKWDEPEIFEERYQTIKQLIKNVNDLHIKLAETKLFSYIDEVHAFHDDMISAGQEGIILRDPNAYYKYGRGSPVRCECIKMKEGGWQDTEVSILAFHEQLENTNEKTTDNLGHSERSSHKENLIGKDTLGAIEVSGKFEDGRDFECRVGTGLDDDTRQTVWYNQDEYRNKIVKMKYFTVGIKDKPRFPTFLGFRDREDMDADQLSLF